MRRGTVALLVMVLALATVTGVASAAPWQGHGSGGAKVGREAKVKLRDLRGHWAEESMVTLNTAGVIRGYEDATFRPEAVIKKEEAIALLVRALGWPVEEASIPPEVRQASQVDAWAWPYLACALRNGLITERELAGFLGNQPAKRYEVAMWLARALGLQGESDTVADFTDASDIPAEAAGLVGAVAREGIIAGYPDRTFQPHKPIKRAEMAALLMRVLPWLPLHDFRVHWGTVVEVAYDATPPTITLVERWWPRFPHIMKQAAGAEVQIWPPPQRKTTLPVAEDALIYVDGQRAELRDVPLDSWALVLVDRAGEAVLIASRPAVAPVQVIRGQLEAVATVDGSTSLRVRLWDGQAVDVELASDARVLVNDRAAAVDDLAPGMRVRLELTDEVATEVRAWDVREEVQGGIAAVYGNELSIRTTANVELRCQIREDALIYIDGEVATREQLRAGDRVRVELVNGLAVRIRAFREREPEAGWRWKERETNRMELEGILQGYTGGRLQVRTRDGAVHTLRLGPGAEAYFKGHGKGRGKLRPGQQVELEVEGDTAVRIEAED